MPDGAIVKVDLRAFRRQLAEVGQRMEKRAVSQGVRDAARVFRDRARQLAPRLKEPDPRRLPGTLARAIAVLRSKARERGVVAYRVGVRAASSRRAGTARDAFYWRWLEGGWIPRGPGQRLRGSTRAKTRARERSASAGRRVSHPFLEPAFQSAGSAALAAFERGVERRLAEVEAVR